MLAMCALWVLVSLIALQYREDMREYEDEVKRYQQQQNTANDYQLSALQQAQATSLNVHSSANFSEDLVRQTLTLFAANAYETLCTHKPHSHTVPTPYPHTPPTHLHTQDEALKLSAATAASEQQQRIMDQNR